MGRVLDHMEVKLVDEEGNVVPRGSEGEIIMRGFAVMLGYWRDEERTREVLGEGGWLRTGDLGRMDDEGYVEIVGRLKDLIIRGGSNVYPVEVEQVRPAHFAFISYLVSRVNHVSIRCMLLTSQVLHQHPAVQDVQVVGVPDERLGEEVCAYVRVKPGSPQPEKKELISFCKACTPSLAFLCLCLFHHLPNRSLPSRHASRRSVSRTTRRQRTCSTRRTVRISRAPPTQRCRSTACARWPCARSASRT